MKKPTLKELIESAEKEVQADDWYRKNLLLDKFKGMSKSTINDYTKEMEEIPEFSDGILKPGHSTTFVNYHMFIWFLKWKDENKYRDKKVSPREIV